MIRMYWIAPLVLAAAAASVVGACGGDDVHVTSGSGTGSPTSSSSGDVGGAGQGGAGQGGAGQGGAGQGGAGGGGVDPAAIKAACGAFAKATCAKINECAPFLITVVYGDIAACEAALSLACEPNTAAPGVTATPANLQACAAALPGATCADALSNNPPPPCQLPMGALVDGAACGDDLQCKSNYCKEGTNSNCGVCAPEVQAGGACVETGDCATGLICPDSTKVCTAPGKMGDACDANKVCQPILACRGGTCQTPLALGASCDPNIQQTLPECDIPKGQYCDFLTKKCVKLGTAMAGQACGVVGLGFVVCVSGSKCSAMGAMMGTCIAPLADGAACDPAKPNCTTPAQCIGGACAVEDPGTCK